MATPFEALWADVLSAVTNPGSSALTPDAVGVRVARESVGVIERLTLAGFVRLAATADPTLDGLAARYVRALGVSDAADERLTAALRGVVRGSAARVVADPPSAAIERIEKWAAAEAVAPPARVVLTGLEADAFTHPDDRQALAAVKAVPGLPGLFARFLDDTRVRVEMLAHLGNAVAVGPGTAPALHALFGEVCDTLGVAVRPRLFLEAGAAGAYTLGTTEPVVVLSTLTAQQLRGDELRYVLGHEIGHVMAGHYAYHQFALAAEGGVERAGAGLFGRVVPTAVKLLLAGWRRRSELTADRAGLLACQSWEAAVRAMMVFAGLPVPLARRADVSAFVAQAREHATAVHGRPGDALLTVESRLTQTHPPAAERLLALLDWTADGGYAEVLAADPEGRRALAARNRGSADPVWDALVGTAVRALQGWAAAEYRLPPAAAGGAARRLLLDGRGAGALPAVLRVRLRVARTELTHCQVALEVLACGTGGVDEHTIPLPVSPTWAELPRKVRSGLMAGGGEAAHTFFQVA